MWAWGGLTLEVQSAFLPECPPPLNSSLSSPSHHHRQIMASKPPFWDVFTPAAVKDAILNGQTPEPRPAPRDWPNGLLELVRKCWSRRPEDRPEVLACIDSLNITLSVVR